MTKEDKKEMIGMMSEAIEVLVLPHIDEIKSDIKEIKNDIGEMKNDIQDLQLTVNRIEMTQRAELNRVDDHEARITKLEKVRH